MARAHSWSDGWTDAEGGNSYAQACTWLYAESACSSFALAYSKACSFTLATGRVHVDTTNSPNYKSARLSVSLDTVVSTLAFAASESDAAALAAVGGYAYTSVDAYCAAMSKKKIKTPLCFGYAAAGLATFGTATAGAMGQASALAESGAVTEIDTAVQAGGTSLKSINGVIGLQAHSFSLADARATSSALAGAMAETCTSSWAEVCVTNYNTVCSNPRHFAHPICTNSAEVACSDALTIGNGWTRAWADECAAAAAFAYTESHVGAYVSANVDCSTDVSTFAYTCAPAEAWAGCYA